MRDFLNTKNQTNQSVYLAILRIKMKTPYQIQFEAFNADDFYTETHAKLYAQFADNLINEGNYSIVYKGVAHACYTPITIDKAPHLKCFVLAPLAVLPEHQGKGYATQLMEQAESELDADVIFVLGDPKHYARRFNAQHNVALPIGSDESPDFWFARELTTDALDGIGQSSSTIKGVFADPIMWSHPDAQI